MDMLFDDTEAEKAERTTLLNDLDALVEGQPYSRALWACLRLADLDRLRLIVTRVRHTSSPGQSEVPDSPGSPGTSSGRPHKRQRTSGMVVQDKCRQRDNNKCVITQSGDPIEVAHIVPFAMRDLQSLEARAERFNPWNVLKHFWAEEKVNQWLNAIGPTTETLTNLFCLAPHPHAYQGKAYFALKYIESNEDYTSLTVMFMWIPHFDHPNSLRACTGPSAAPLPISTGDHIVLETSDPVNLPLPDSNLLELHWLLQRVVAMAGDAEPQDKTYETDDEDDGDSDVSSLSIPPKSTVPMSNSTGYLFPSVP
ncbi:conserved hypothetical protein [Histoplasma capsulatum H143]|uniref:HNH nuclease domain-containing protein n=1 Tax=Ajellomyces capsulatus (strain H143) TaxID=544712 RepID=C6H4Z8_AJECH|nr:conserved hypothetical protein [Histoplasma capsulatum H143]